jgi:polysaccharide export outer membrane protein
LTDQFDAFLLLFYPPGCSMIFVVKKTKDRFMKKNSNSKNLYSRLGQFFLLITAMSFATGCATNNTDSPATSGTNVVATTHSEMLILREGDVVRITFPTSPNFDTTQQIRRDGKITMPIVGEVDASGKTPDELQDALIKLYEPQISSKEVNVFVQSSTFPVYVTGAVVHPGKILSDHPMTALEAVMEAGGFNLDSADLRSVKIIRNENGVIKNYKVDLKRVLKEEDTKPFYLKPSDIIYVPERFQMF